MGIIYPDNVNRADRVQQLATNIGSIQSEVDDSLDRVDTASNHQTDTVNQILQLEGFQTLDDLTRALSALLTPEQQAAYNEQVQHLRDQDETTAKMLDANLLASFIAGTIGLGAAPVARVLGTGALAAGADLFSRGFRAMMAGDEAGIAMMAGAFRTFRALAVGGEVSETAARVTRFVRTASAVLSVLGVVLDGIILVYEAVEGAEQRTKLRDGINELSARRFQAKQIEDQTFATEAYVGQISAYLVTYQVLKKTQTPEDSIKTIMDQLLEKVVDGLHQDLDAITADTVWKQCADIDQQAGNAWKDEDPSLIWVQTWIAAQPPVVPDDEKQARAMQLHHVVNNAPGGDMINVGVTEKKGVNAKQGMKEKI